MAVKIKNLVLSAPVSVPLSSGRTVRLSPGQVSEELPDVEVQDNAKVDKLLRQRLIEIELTDRRRAQRPPRPQESAPLAEPASTPVRRAAPVPASRRKQAHSSR